MRTNFSDGALADPHLGEVEKNLRACVHCGICTASCPTYVLLGDERDSPRGRIVLIQDMLENGGAPSEETVTHIDRCLTCLSCRSACPSGVDYARLIDAGRAHIEMHHRRPWRDRLLRRFLARGLTKPGFAKACVALARAAGPLARLFPGAVGGLARKAMSHWERRFPAGSGASGTCRRDADCRQDAGAPSGRILLLAGCVQPALAPQIDDAAKRVLARRGYEVCSINSGCCGAIAHHLGRRNESKVFAKRVIQESERRDAALVVMTATGCTAHLRDYPHIFADEPDWRVRARHFVAKVRDFCEVVEPRAATPQEALRLAWQIPCSQQHGSRLGNTGADALRAAGFALHEIPEGHLCCGSAGSYSILQPEIAGALRTRKLANISTLEVDAVASPNIGCLIHLSGPDAPPVLHPAELLDWAEGGPQPGALFTSKPQGTRR